ncbi:RING finger ubiquitin ligase [Aspergillus luchuensis]|uniref:RING finger ubiquitin ligase n=1 Tax=Aspergillus kawachii TaxID=1069201 RepID=A0A146FDG0_ASPKA|nr:RING finger ubiquitin ligase [Aspergillus luchuensis]
MGRQTTGEAGLSPPKAYACGPPARQVPRLIGTGHAETHHRDAGGVNNLKQGRGIKTNLKLGKSMG